MLSPSRLLVQAAASRPRGYEDQATEILACVLEVSDGLARRIAERIAEIENRESFSWVGLREVRTQQVYLGVGRTDLEMEWRAAPGEKPLTAVLEVKIDALFQDRQIPRYRERFRDDSLVIVLAPGRRRTEIEDDVAQQVRVLTWEEVGALAEKVIEESSPQVSPLAGESSAEIRLLHELVCYLRSEGLMDYALTEDDVDVPRRWRDFQVGLTRLVEEALGKERVFSYLPKLKAKPPDCGSVLTRAGGGEAEVRVLLPDELRALTTRLPVADMDEPCIVVGYVFKGLEPRERLLANEDALDKSLLWLDGGVTWIAQTLALRQVIAACPSDEHARMLRCLVVELLETTRAEIEQMAL